MRIHNTEIYLFVKTCENTSYFQHIIRKYQPSSYLSVNLEQEGSKSHLVVGRPCIARKIGFPELILPNDVRNDLYVNIYSGELSRLNKTADRNVEVRFQILFI